MRNFPSTNELSDLQREIYSAKLKSAMMIVGGPGTGKTVLAIHRALRVIESSNEKDVTLLMYNNTLLDYTRQQTQQNRGLKKQTKTLLKHIEERFRLYGHYIPWGKNQTLERFPFDAYVGRYKRISANDKKNLFPPFTVIDEAQDFPRGFYKLISDHWLNSRTSGFDFYPTIMADENQRLDPNDNTDIRTIELLLGGVAAAEKLYEKQELLENYRNTYEIASFGAKFYVGSNRKTQLPQNNQGNKPSFFWFKRYKDLAERILKYKLNFPNKTIGVILVNTSYVSAVQNIYKNLKAQIESKSKQNEIKLQFYTYKDKNILDFQSSKTITVLGYKSAKGLEFDTVFIPDIGKVATDHDFYQDALKMYTILHRPRENLFLAAQSNEHAENQNFEYKYLPPLLKKQITCHDPDGNKHDVGFKDEDDLREHLNFGIKADQSDETKDTSQKKSIIKKTEDKSKKVFEGNDEIYRIFNKIDGRSLKELPIDFFDEITNLSDEGKDMIFNLMKNRPTEKEKTRTKSKNAKRKAERYHNSHTKISIKKKKNETKNERSLNKKAFISYVKATDNPILFRLVQIIKKEMVIGKLDALNIISVSEKSSRLIKKIDNFLNANKSGIADYFIMDKNNSLINFSVKKKFKKTLIVSNPDDKFSFKESTIVIGLENLRENELQENIGDLLLKLILEERQITEFIIPDLEIQMPGVEFILSKWDDDFIETKNYAF